MFDRHDVEDIILCMADIVMENRDLRYEVVQLRKAQEEHREFVNGLVNNSMKADREFLKMILENALTGGNSK